MASSDKEVEEQLLEAGNKIVDPPTSVEELLPLLDRIESLLARVEQSPSKSMQSAVTPSLKALVSDQLLRHSDVDVRVAVAACISEITRITAPDAPYSDDQMKEVFHLIVSSFENLSDKSSRSYEKRASILETVAKVRSCVVMLDLECEGLIIEMLQHFFKTIRDYHPENVFSSMETIMSLVLEESEDISVELLSPILSSVKKDNTEIQPIARKLGERVLNNCAPKVKPYLVDAVKTLGISFDDCSDVVASICKELCGSLEPNNLQDASESAVADSKLIRTSADEADEEKPTKGATPERVEPTVEEQHDSIKSNGIAQGGEDGSSVKSENKKEGEHGEECKLVKSPKDSEPANLKSEKASSAKERPEKVTKKRGRKPNSLKSNVLSESSHVDTMNKPENLPQHESHGEEHPSSRGGGSENLTSENEVDHKSSSPKVVETETANVASPSQSGSLPDESNSNKVGQTKRKDNSAREDTSSADDGSKKLSERTSGSGRKQNTDAEEMAPAGISDDNKTAVTEDAVERGRDTVSDNEAKTTKQSTGKADGTSKSGSGSLKQSEAKKRQGSGKLASGKTIKKSSGDHDKKETISSPKTTSKTTKDEKILDKTPKTDSKRKRTPGKDKESKTKDSDEDLVGLKIKVWWPKDRMFYEGVVDSFDPAKNKHRVLYTDGDEEILNLKKERWELIEDDSASEREEMADIASPEPTPDVPLKKKSKLNADESAKRGKMDGSPKKVGLTSSSKSKGAATKSDLSSGSKVEGKSRENVPKVGRPASNTGSKSKDIGSKTGGKAGDATPKTGGKAGDATPKTGGKAGDSTPKTGGKAGDSTPKTGGKASDATPKTGGKAGDATPKTGGKAGDATPKTTSKSRNDDTDSSKAGKSKDDETPSPAAAKPKQDAPKTGKSKQVTPKPPTISKGKSSRTGDKSNSNVSTKVKFTSSKSKDSGDVKNSAASTKTTENAKGKSPNSSNDLGSEPKMGKKRRREAKG